MEDNLIFLVKTLESFLSLIENVVAPLFRAWWWVIPPLFIFRYVPSFWLLWRQALEIKKRKYVMLEIKLPTEILKPVRAMEDVMNALYLIIVDPDPGCVREKWIDGDNTLYPHLSFEIVSFGGRTRFFIRVNSPYRDVVESAIYAQYPEVQIEETEDYTDFVPQDIPNKGWDLENREWVLGKPNPYPIKTYKKFETEHESKEEKRVDSMARMLEALSTISEGEQVWFQIIVTLPSKDLVKQGGEIRDKLVYRPGKAPQPQPMIIQAVDLLLGTPQKKEEKKEELLPPEMKLTPGEREVVKEIEAKVAQSGFETTIRIFYLAKREAWFKPHLGLPIAFLTSHNTRDLNFFKTFKPTSSKVKTIFKIWDKRKQFLRKRRAFRNYKMRVNPLFPKEGGTSVLNAEELATLFHFPSRIMAPAPFFERIEHKKGEAPSDLPR